MSIDHGKLLALADKWKALADTPHDVADDYNAGQIWAYAVAQAQLREALAQPAEAANPDLCPACKTWPVDDDSCPNCGREKPFTPAEAAHGQPVDYSPALHSVLSYIAYGECDEEGLHPGLFATVKEKIDKLRSKPVVDEAWLRQAIEEFKYLSGRTDLPMQDRERWRALNAALGATT